MKQMPLTKRGITDSRLVFGCMGLGGGWDYAPYTAEHVKQAEAAVEAALEIGITMFDHADIYTRGKAESVFGEVLKGRPDLRDRIVLQSKCGIRLAEGELPGMYDFSGRHILASVDGSLKRLGVEALDILLLHRPDPLMEPEEIAEAFAQLKSAGKVKHFGVSNMSPSQIRFLRTAVSEPLVVNQLQIALDHLDWLDHGVYVNQKAGTGVNFPEGLMEYCQTENIQIQSWGPLSRGIFSGRSLEGQPEHVQAAAKLVAKMAEEKGTAPESILLGWQMKHPAAIQPVIGTTNPERIRACRDAVRVSEEMTREEWYTLYMSAREKK